MDLQFCILCFEVRPNPAAHLICCFKGNMFGWDKLLHILNLLPIIRLDLVHSVMRMLSQGLLRFLVWALSSWEEIGPPPLMLLIASRSVYYKDKLYWEALILCCCPDTEAGRNTIKINRSKIVSIKQHHSNVFIAASISFAYFILAPVLNYISVHQSGWLVSMWISTFMQQG